MAGVCSSKFLRSETTSIARSSLAMNYGLAGGVVSRGLKHLLSIENERNWLTSLTTPLWTHNCTTLSARIGDHECLTHLAV